MTFRLSFPSREKLKQYLARQTRDAFSYEAVGASKATSPEGFDHDYRQITLGKGDRVWEAARQAIINWKQYPSTWTRIYPDQASIETGQTVVVLFRVFGLWWFNSARIVYTYDEPERFGWAYGTLRDHVESGEECFWLERDEAGVVTYHIRAFSRPQYWMAKLAYPLARYWQKCFVEESMARMQQITRDVEKKVYAK